MNISDLLSVEALIARGVAHEIVVEPDLLRV